jgi:uncharacterized protein YcnI
LGSSALLFTASASAHLSINPSTIRTGALVDLVFSVPNAADPHGIDHVILGIPGDFQLDDAEAKPGWSQSRSGQAVTWSGGNIPRRQFARFAIRGTAPSKPEMVLFNVVVGNRTGKSITYRVGVEVVDHGPEDQGARSLGKASLIVAIVGAAFALGALFLALYIWLRPPPP